MALLRLARSNYPAFGVSSLNKTQFCCKARWDWVCYDLRTRRGTPTPVTFPRDAGRSPGGALLYGCSTRDATGAFYVGGAMNNPSGQKKPVLLRFVVKDP